MNSRSAEGDIFAGMVSGDFLEFLDYAHAKEFLKAGVTEEEFMKTAPKEPTRENVIATMLGYMPFAWEKANGERGLSAARSMYHYTNWLWLLGNEDELNLAEEIGDYDDYGKTNLRTICEKYGWDWKQWI